MIERIFFVLFLFCFYKLVWHMAHLEVATECQAQGSFYVNEQTYFCERMEDWR